MLARAGPVQRPALVDVHAASFGHYACAAPGLRWVEPVFPVNAAARFIRTAGMKAMAHCCSRRSGILTSSTPASTRLAVDASAASIRGGWFARRSVEPDRRGRPRVVRFVGRAEPLDTRVVVPSTLTRRSRRCDELVPCAIVART